MNGRFVNIQNLFIAERLLTLVALMRFFRGMNGRVIFHGAFVAKTFKAVVTFVGPFLSMNELVLF